MEHQQKRRKKEEEESEINELLFSVMEGYSDKVIAPLSKFSPLMEEAAAIVEAKGSSSRKPGRLKEAQEVTESLRKERDRREKMAESYDLLLSMVPNLFPKATRENIVGETIEYIQSLEKEITWLEELKKSSESKVAEGKMHQYSDRNSSINVTVSNNMTFFGIQSLVRPSLVTDIFMIFHKKAEVLAANVAVNQRQLTVTVTAAVVNGNIDSTIEKIKRDILNL
ncbi:hypothetical protein CRYUN_Cryun36dG0088300 [Craigia yunnanensis]